MAGSIMLQEPQHSNLKEIFRAIATKADEDVINLQRYSADKITEWYVNQYPEDFERKGDGQVVFMQGDSTKSSATSTQEELQNDMEHDDGKLRFKMSEK
jgi:ribosomal protein S3AE